MLTRNEKRMALILLLIVLVGPQSAVAQADTLDTAYGDAMIRAYFEDQVRQIESTWLEDVDDLADWQAQRPRRREELRRMLGLDPMPPRTDLQATVTGVVAHEDFTVEKLHFQSMPGLYVTANLYIPKRREGPLPGVLYVCGHANRRHEGISLGAKTAYQQHAAWYARHGYVCLIIDTLQLGEIEGDHHGTHRLERWWWWNRGYTPAGVETWNGIRALDYLASRPEVDPERLAVTGRSGGGAYSWYIAALDDRVKTSVPTAGITDLQDHVADQVIQDHCDCMYMLNSARWDFPMLAALLAPRPTLLANGDEDPIFPLGGVLRVFDRTRQVYALYQALGNWSRLIVEAAHDDVPPLQQGTYRWMHRHLKDQELRGEDPAAALFDPVELKVFDTLPGDEINTRIDEHFIQPAPEPAVPERLEAWLKLRQRWMERLQAETFAGWPAAGDSLRVREAYATVLQGMRLRAFDFDSQRPVRLRLWVLEPEDAPAERVTLSVVDEAAWQRWLSVLQAMAGDRAQVKKLVGSGADAALWPAADSAAFTAIRERLRREKQGLAVLAPRGIGPTAWTETARGNGIRRSFMLLGQTLDGMRVWDVRRAVQVLQAQWPQRTTPIGLEGQGVMAGIALYAALFEPAVERVQLHALPETHREGPILLNVRKILDVPQAVAMAMADGRSVLLFGTDREKWSWPRQLAARTAADGAVLRFATGVAWLAP